jgi:protocatechuate 3,4-dioxygenase beta subunit
MRPLVVLLLVLGSLAALLFALTAITDSGREGEEARGLAVEPATQPDAARTADLVAPPRQEEAPEVPRAPVEETRLALQSEPDPSARKLAYGSIEGIVIDRNGRPIAEAHVSLLNSKPSILGEEIHALRGTEPPRPLAKVETDAEGTFRFQGLDPRKDWSLVASHERYVSYTTEVAIAVPEGGVWKETLVMERGQRAMGVVRDAETSLPIAGALLVVDGPFARMNKKGSPGRLEATTDETGVYVFENVGVSGGQGRILTITAPGYATQVHSNFTLATYGEAPTRFKNVQPQGQTEGRQLDFELEPGRVIAGRVVDPEHRGMPGIVIEAFSQSGTISSQGGAKSGANGEFLIEGLAEGIYTVRVNATNYDANPLQRVEAGQTDVLIELFEHAVVTGKVIDANGHGLSNFVIKARQANEISKAFGTVSAQRAVKDAKGGRFELRGVPEGAYVLEALADGYASSFSDTFNATQGLVTSDIVIRMTRGGSISGRILDAYGSAPVAGAEVSTIDNDYIEGEIWELFGAMEPTALTKTKVFTNSDGRFAFDVITPGVYQVQIKAKGYSPFAVKDVNVSEGQKTELPAQLMIKGAVITGMVYGRGKTPQPGASIQLAPVEPNLEGHRTARADGTGRFVIENARPGTYRLSATRASSGSSNPFEAIADIRQSEIEISIEDGGQHEFDLRIED